MALLAPWRLQTRTTIESLWCQAPLSFPAPVLASSHLQFSTTSSLGISALKLKWRKRDNRDSFALGEAAARKAANLSRQAALKEQRAKGLGDPIRGISSPFVESFDTEVPQEIKPDPKTVSLETVKSKPDTPPPSPAHVSEELYIDHGIKHEELARSLEFSRSLTEPVPHSSSTITQTDDGTQAQAKWKKRDASATEAVERIISLTNANSKHRTKKNIERIIDTFGRHKTDQILKPKASVVVNSNPIYPSLGPTPRAGPDTGSSEVQIGILTAKIRILADRYEGPNRNDKVNKRNLRLLLHRRQKLLAYMERKERGSERWQHMISTLGLTPACWKGEIEVK